MFEKNSMLDKNISFTPLGFIKIIKLFQKLVNRINNSPKDFIFFSLGNDDHSKNIL